VVLYVVHHVLSFVAPPIRLLVGACGASAQSTSRVRRHRGMARSTRNPVGVSPVVADGAYQPFRSVSENAETRRILPGRHVGRGPPCALGDDRLPERRGRPGLFAGVMGRCLPSTRAPFRQKIPRPAPCPRCAGGNGREGGSAEHAGSVDWAFMVSALYARRAHAREAI